MFQSPPNGLLRLRFLITKRGTPKNVVLNAAPPPPLCAVILTISGRVICELSPEMSKAIRNNHPPNIREDGRILSLGVHILPKISFENFWRDILGVKDG